MKRHINELDFLSYVIKRYKLEYSYIQHLYSDSDTKTTLRVYNDNTLICTVCYRYANEYIYVHIVDDIDDYIDAYLITRDFDNYYILDCDNCSDIIKSYAIV